MTISLLASEDLTVLGGPAAITVDVNIGPSGERGSNIFVGNGNPISNPDQLPVTPKIFDMYINTLPSDPDNEYLYMYQYINVSGTDTWVPAVKLLPNIHSTNRQAIFVDGKKTLNVKVTNIVSIDSIPNITSQNFNVQCSISGNLNPVSHVINLSELVLDPGTGDYVLPIEVTAVEFFEGAWVNLENEVIVHLLITVV
jgi:hypothetical protein